MRPPAPCLASCQLIKMIGFLALQQFSCLAGILIASENMVGHTTAGERYLLLG